MGQDLFFRDHLLRMIIENQKLIAHYEALAAAVDGNEIQRVHHERAAELLREVVEQMREAFHQMYPDEDLDAVLREQRHGEEN